MRKHYLDNIRFLTIFFVVIFHVYFYYNNIGTEAMFAGLKPYEGAVTFAGIYQYFVYPWFMLLLFVVAGISARYALEKRTERQFLKESIWIRKQPAEWNSSVSLQLQQQEKQYRMQDLIWRRKILTE